MENVLIGIQARSGSQRLPRKAFELIGGRTMLDRVIDSCNKAATRLNKLGSKCQVVVLTPKNDPIVAEFSNRVEVFEGEEHDVLSRYVNSAEKYEAEFIVRITGDCPFIPHALVSYMTSIAVKMKYDYFSNVDERFRTSIDGSDCEVFSARMLEYADKAARKNFDREHVTTIMRRNPPAWAVNGIAINHFDISDIKLSVDTQDDLDKARKVFDSTYRKIQDATRVYGKEAIHRI